MRMKNSKLKSNQVTLWDAIMPREKLRDFVVTKKAFKYPLVDVNNKL